MTEESSPQVIMPSSMDILRKSTRQLLEHNRRSHKDDVHDRRRPNLDPDTKSEQEVINSIAKKLKASVTSEELLKLKNAILNDVVDNTQIVLGYQSAMRGLAREISGSNIKKQSEAAGCCCNMALGGAAEALLVAKSAGPYLAVHLTSMSQELAVTCAWALGNLAGSGPKASTLLISQGALAKLAQVVEDSPNGIYVEAAVYAIEQFVYQLRDNPEIRESLDLLQKLTTALTKVASTTTAAWRPLSILACHPQSLEAKHDQNEIVNAINVSIETHFACAKNECSNDCQLIYIVRYLANLCVDKEICDFVIQMFVSVDMCGRLNRVLHCTNVEVSSHFMWFLGNLLLYSTESDARNVFYDSVCINNI